MQKPEEKINHTLVLGGSQGIGKDTLLEPVKYAVGHWNFSEVSPRDFFQQFNPHARSIVIRVNEGRDQGEHDRYAFYDHMKTYEAAPPDTMRVNEKYVGHYFIFNRTRIIYATNHKTTGLYLPAHDRRHRVDWSEKTKEDFGVNFFIDFWHWYTDEGGLGHVAAFLMQRDLSNFNPKAPPRLTTGLLGHVDAGRAPEEAELADALDEFAAATESAAAP